MPADRSWSDDELSGLDVAALLRGGDAEALGAEGLVAAAIQLERQGIGVGDVVTAAGELRDDDVLAGDPPTRLDEFVAVGAADREGTAAWLEHVAELMVHRRRTGGAS